MGTKVHCESYFSGYFSMRDLNEDSNSCTWPLYYMDYMDNTFANGQYYNGFLPRAVPDPYPGNEKDAVKRKMLEHEAIFKDQVHELHRLYKIQRDLMDEVRRKELLHTNRIPIEASFSSSPLVSQVTSEDARKWHGFPLANLVSARPSSSGVEDIHSPLSSLKGNSTKASPLPSQNGGTPKDTEMQESRPTKVRRKMFDLQLPADQYIETEEGEQDRDENVSGISSFLSYRNHKVAPESGINSSLADSDKNSCQGDARSQSRLRSTTNVADLNKPIEAEEKIAPAYVNLIDSISTHGESQGYEVAGRQKSQVGGLPREISGNSHHRGENGTLKNPHLQNNTNGKHWFPHTLDAGHIQNNFKSISQGLQPERLATPSQPVQILFNKTPEAAPLFLPDQSKIEQLRERTARCLDLSERSCEISNANGSGSAVAFHAPGPYPSALSSDVSKSWGHAASAWEKPNGNLSQKSLSAQLHPFFNSSAALSWSSQSPNQTHGFLADKWSYNSNVASSANFGSEIPTRNGWNYSSTTASNANFGSEIPARNGFYHGSSSGSKEPKGRFPLTNYDYWNCTSSNNAVSEQFNQSSGKFCKSSNSTDEKSVKDVDLNVVLPNGLSHKMTPQRTIEIIDVEKKPDDLPAALPWLRTKPASKNEAVNRAMDLNTGEMSFLQSSLNQLSNKTEAGREFNEVAVPNKKSASHSIVAQTCKIETGESSVCRKILGFPIFQKPLISKNGSSSFTSHSFPSPQPSEREVENNRKNRVLDINLPCEAAAPDFDLQVAAIELAVKERDSKVTNLRYQIDLNFCMAEDEASSVPSVPGSNAKAFKGIDLEAPLVLEAEEDVILIEEKVVEAQLQPPQHPAEKPDDDLIRVAAEAIVAISSCSSTRDLDVAPSNPPEASMIDPLGPLHWFVEIVSSCGEDLESKFDAGLRNEDKGGSSEGSDYFETMTLRLTETKEEDYMPKPLVPENLILEETGTTPSLTRTRKGNARRGRQRRDFQRDILPGLASLSRHEVTEDLQTFGGMMLASGHPWHSRLTRRNATRNGCGRGRRRTVVIPSPAVTTSPPCTQLIQQLNSIEVGLEDRSLTGWGKTTRRPRRQRCPAGTPPSIPLT